MCPSEDIEKAEIRIGGIRVHVIRRHSVLVCHQLEEKPSPELFYTSAGQIGDEEVDETFSDTCVQLIVEHDPLPENFREADAEYSPNFTQMKRLWKSGSFNSSLKTSSVTNFLCGTKHQDVKDGAQFETALSCCNL